MGDGWQHPKVWRLFLRALRQLRMIVQEAHDLQDANESYAERIATVFPYRHANNLCWLAEDVRLLVRNGHIAAPPVIARAMLESFFYLAACKTVPSFAARKTIWEMRDFMRRAGNLRLATADDEWLAAEHEKIITAIREIEAHYGLLASERPWKIGDVVAQCGEVAFLKANYFFLSEHTHGSFMGLTARHEDRHTWIVLQSVIGSLIMGAGIAPQVILTATPQTHVDKATELMAELLRLIESKVLAPPHDGSE